MSVRTKPIGALQKLKMYTQGGPNKPDHFKGV